MRGGPVAVAEPPSAGADPPTCPLGAAGALESGGTGKLDTGGVPLPGKVAEQPGGKEMNWQRVNRNHPCPVCGRPDWCLTSHDGVWAICPRIESDRRAGEAGYLHRLTDTPGQWRRGPITTIIVPGAAMDTAQLSTLARRYQAEAEKFKHLEKLGSRLGVSAESLRRLGVGYDHAGDFSTWPMVDADGAIVGINRRFADGSKKIMPGHHAGLYLPVDLPGNLAGETLLVVEGGSDTAAGLDLGFWTVGRFSCTHGGKLLAQLLRDRQPGLVVIVADADGPGRQGAAELARKLVLFTRNLRMIEPPGYKDLRQWKQAGANLLDVHRLIEKAELVKLNMIIRNK